MFLLWELYSNRRLMVIRRIAMLIALLGALAAIGAGSAGAMDEGPVRSEATGTSSPAAKADSGASNTVYDLDWLPNRHPVPFVCGGFRSPC